MSTLRVNVLTMEARHNIASDSVELTVLLSFPRYVGDAALRDVMEIVEHARDKHIMAIGIPDDNTIGLRPNERPNKDTPTEDHEEAGSWG